MESSKSDWRRNVGIAALVVVILGLGWYCYGVWTSYNRGMPPAGRQEAAVRPGPGGGRGGEGRREGGRRERSPEERQQRFNEMMANLDLTEEQRARVDALERPTDRESGRKFREAMDEILTDAQKEKMRSGFRDRMRQRREEMNKYLGPAEQQELDKRFDERRKRWEERRKNREAEGRDGRGGREL